jgi:hypothetical protein
VTNENAVALIFVSLDALIHHQHCLHEETKPALPIERIGKGELGSD